MKYAILTALLGILGALLIFYTVSSQQLLNWAAWEPVLQEQKIENQTQAAQLAVDYYRRGLLPEYLNQRALAAFSVGVAMLIAGAFASIHILLDKLFWKKFYEQPNILMACKRAILAALVPVVLFYLGVWNLLDLPLLGLVLISAVFLELISNSILGGRAKQVIIQQQPDNSAKPGNKVTKKVDEQPIKINKI